MSCNCKCGCENRYSGGYRCYPLIVKISHQINLDYWCQAFNAHHPSSPIVSVSSTENCMKVYSETKDNGGMRTSTYFFALKAKSGSGCSGGDASEIAAVVFKVNPPLRGWHNKGDGSDEPPYTKYDSTNPECSVKCEARMRSESDSGEFYFESWSNPYPSVHETDEFPGPRPDIMNIVVEVSNRDVSVEFRPN